MRHSTIAFFLFSLCAAAAPPYGYEWMEAEPSAQVVQQAGASTANRTAQAWRLSVGYAVRSFEADFRMSAPSIGLIAPYLGGLGDVGFYRGGSGFLDYEDGYVGPSHGDGTAGGQITAFWPTPGNEVPPKLEWDTSRFFSSGAIAIVSSGYESRTAETFHTKTFQLLNQEASASGHGVGSGPYVRFSKTIAEDAFGSLGLAVTWIHLAGLLDADASFGHPTRTDFLYTYDRALFTGVLPDMFSAPSASGLVIDADAVNALHQQAFGTPGNYRNPRKTTQQFTIDEWTAIGSSFLDVRLNEIFLSADVVWKPWRGWEFGLSAGPTLSVVSTTLNSHTAWERSDGLVVRGESTRQSDTQVAVGVGVQGVVRHDLTRDGRAFIEAHAGYKWLNDIAVGGGSSSANLDLSDWEVGLGVGIRLDDWPAGSPWTVKVGASTRTLSFKAGAVDKSALKSLFNRRGGRGDVGLFSEDSTAYYDDGVIRPGGIGLALVSPYAVVIATNPSTFNSPSQFNPHTGRFDSGDEIAEVSFHSSIIQENLESVRSAGEATGEQGVSAVIGIERTIGEWEQASLSIDFGFEALNSSVQTGQKLAAIADVRSTTTFFTYEYDYSRWYADYRAGLGLITFINPALGSDYLPPRQSSSTTTSLIHYYALTSASVDMSMQTLSLATDLAWKPFKRCEVGVSVGPTLNLVHTSTDLSTDWVREDGLLLARLQDHEERTDFKLGLRVMASARYDLTPEGRWFIEARGGYEWMQDIDLGIGLQAATLDATSWQVGGALGCRLGVKARLPEIRDPSLAQQLAKPGPKSQHWLDRLLWKTHSIPVRLGR